MSLDRYTLISINSELKKILRVTNIYTSYHKEDTFDFNQTAPVDINKLLQAGYYTFIFRFKAAAESISILLNGITDENWPFIEHNIGILLRPCLLDSIYILTLNKDDTYIHLFLAESFQKLNKSTAYDFDQDKRDFLNTAGAYFKSTEKKSTNPKDLKDFVGDDASKYCYQFYDFYSKYDHFGITKSVVWNFNNEKKLSMMDVSIKMISTAIRVLALKYGRDQDRDCYNEMMEALKQNTIS